MATLPANVRVNTAVPFPALVRGDGPITVTKNFGIWDIGFDASHIGIVIPQLADYPTSYMIVYNSVTGALELVSLSSIVGGGGTDVTVDLVTTNATPANFPTTILSIPYQSWGFDGEIIARDVQTGDSSLWAFTGALKQMADFSTTELVSPITPTVVMQDAGAAAWGITITTDDTSGALKVTAQGEDARTIYWELRVKSEHVTTPAPSPTPSLQIAVGFSGGDVETPVPALSNSSDAETWSTQDPSFTETANIEDVVGNGSGTYLIAGYLAGEGEAPLIGRSTDGDSWTLVSDIALTHAGRLWTVAFSAELGLFLVGGQDAFSQTGTLITSATGISGSWTERTTPFADTGDFAPGVYASHALGTTILIGGQQGDGNGGIATGTDPDALTLRTNGFTLDDPFSGAIFDFADNGTDIIAVGIKGGSGGSLAHVAKSTNGGVAWTDKTFASFGPEGSTANSAAFNGSVLLVCGQTDAQVGHLERSTDFGETFTAVDISAILTGFVQPLNKIRWSPTLTLFIMVGRQGDGTPLIATSPTGLAGSWTLQASDFPAGLGTANSVFAQ